MANVFRSKEVLKKTHNIHGDDVVVPVYGVYVSGEYTPPYYANPTLHLMSISSVKASVDSMTTEETDISDVFTMGLCRFDVDMTWGIQTYMIEAANLNDQPMTLGLCRLDIDNDIVIEAYENDRINTKNEFTFGMCRFDVTNPISIDILPTQHKHQTPEPILRLSGVTSVKATISNS